MPAKTFQRLSKKRGIPARKLAEGVKTAVGKHSKKICAKPVSINHKLELSIFPLSNKHWGYPKILDGRKINLIEASAVL